MKASSFRVIFVLMAVFFFGGSPSVWADEPQDEELSDAMRDGLGCAALTGVTLLGALASGPGELIMIAGGGSLAPSATAPLMVSLTATVFVAACGVGISAAPAAMWVSEQVGRFFNGLWGGRNAPIKGAPRIAEPVYAANSEVGTAGLHGSLTEQSLR
jgi:hypothetical protein